jgi:hypothetical protein
MSKPGWGHVGFASLYRLPVTAVTAMKVVPLRPVVDGKAFQERSVHRAKVLLGCDRRSTKIEIGNAKKEGGFYSYISFLRGLVLGPLAHLRTVVRLLPCSSWQPVSDMASSRAVDVDRSAWSAFSRERNLGWGSLNAPRMVRKKKNAGFWDSQRARNAFGTLSGQTGDVEARRRQYPTAHPTAAGVERALGCPIGRDVNSTVCRDRARQLRSASSLSSPLKTGHLRPTRGAARNTRGRTTSAPRTVGGSWPSSHRKPTRWPGHSTPAASLAAASRLPVIAQEFSSAAARLEGRAQP